MAAHAIAELKEEAAEQHKAEEQAKYGAGAQSELTLGWCCNVIIIE
jgi:hypothetical protein